MQALAISRHLGAFSYVVCCKSLDMFPIDPTKLPALRTRKAFLVIDPQKDFLDDEGALPIHQPLDLPEQIAHAAQAFRDSGVDIIWVRTQFDKIRSIHNEMILTADLPLGNGPASSSRGRGSRAASQGGGVIPPKCPEGFLSISASSTLTKAVRPGTTGLEFHPEIEKAVSRKDQVLTKSFYSAFKNDQILRLLRMRFVTELYICGSLTNIGVMATAYDAASHGFAITLVKDCCGFRSPARHNAAIKQIVELTGCDVLNLDEIPLSTNTPGPRASEPKVTESGPTASATSSLYPTTCKRPGDDSKTKSTSADLQDALASLSIEDKQLDSSRTQSKQGGRNKKSVTAHEEPVEGVSHGVDARTDTERIKDSTLSDVATHPIGDNESPAPSPQPHSTTRGTNEKKLESVTTEDPNLETGDGSQKGAPDESDPTAVRTSEVPAVQSDMARKSISSSPSTSSGEEVSDSDHIEAADADIPPVSMATRGDPLCEGDSRVVFNILPALLADDIFEKVREEVQWQRMSHQGGEVPRLVAVQGQVEHDGSMPVYRHPSDESPPLLPFTPTVSAIREVVEKELGHPLNHALIQFYRHGNDYISEHSDKTLDIAKDSFIANVSLGAERTMVLRTKRIPKPRDDNQGEPSDNSKSDTPPPPASQSSDLKRKSERAPLPHNSLMKMGLQTNMKWLHGIRQDKRQEREKSKEELAYAGGRISLTFRRIGTFLDAEQRLIWGQGATGKTRDAAQEVTNGQTPQAIEMLRAFGRENQLSEFAWDAFYGKGFDVLHITASPRLFLSADAVVNMRVQMMLAELGIGYARGSMGPASVQDASGTEAALQIKLVDTDVAKSTVQGDIAILMYLDRVYANSARAHVSSAAETASQSVDTGAATDTQSTSTCKVVHIDMGKVYTRFQQALSLQDKLRTIYHQPQSDSDGEDERSSTKLIKELFTPWDAYVSYDKTTSDGDHFLASSNGLTLADYAFWPVLHDIVARDVIAQSKRISSPASSTDGAKSSSAEDLDAEKGQDEKQRHPTERSVLDGFPALKAYYDRVKARESVAKLLAVVGEKKRD